MKRKPGKRRGGEQGRRAGRREEVAAHDAPIARGARLKRKDYEKELAKLHVELVKLQRWVQASGAKVCILFEGRDAAGKGGTIRRMTRYMNEKHYRVVALGKPTEQQVTQWFFQRYVEQFPRGGEMVLFDRSWYNRAVVEPIFGFCTPKQYDDFMHGVVGFEKDLVRQETLLVKLYFSVTKDEQARRFEAGALEQRVVDGWPIVQFPPGWHTAILRDYPGIVRGIHSGPRSIHSRPRILADRGRLSTIEVGCLCGRVLSSTRRSAFRPAADPGGVPAHNIRVARAVMPQRLVPGAAEGSRRASRARRTRPVSTASGWRERPARHRL